MRREARNMRVRSSWWSWVLVAPLLALLGWSCGDGTGSELTDQSPCNTVYRGQCGAPCTLDGDCPNGLYCDFGECRADCTPDGAQCGAGACNDRGQCTNDGSGGTGGVTTFTTGVAGGGNGGACGAVTVDFAPQTPSVVLLIDQSGSMTTTFQGQARWDVVYDVLMDPVDGVVKQLEPFVRFGLALYTYHAGGQQCPELAELMPPALNNHSAIDGVYAPANPEAETPTGDSLVAVATQLAMFNEPGPKLIILATDGDPDRCENPDGHDAISKLEVTDAAQAAYAQNVETVIIAVGDAVSDQHQQDVANAGSGKPVPATFPCDPIVDPTTCAPTYEPNTKQEMIDAFLGIINGQRTCVFTLNGSVIAGKECDGDVKVNGVSIPCNDPDGWQLNSPTEIEFLGMTCDTIMNDPNVTITAEFPCDSIMEPPQ